MPVSVGPTRLRFIIDNGASTSFIATEALDRLAPGDFETRGTITAGFTGGRATVTRVTLRSLALVPDEAMPLEAFSIGLYRFRKQIGAEVDGILGMDVLRRYSRLRFDFRGQRLDLLASDGLADSRPVVADVRFDVILDQKIRFPLQVNGGMVAGFLDIGGRTLVNWAAAEQAGITRRSPGLRQKRMIVGGDATLQLVHVCPSPRYESDRCVGIAPLFGWLTWPRLTRLG